MKSLYPIIAFIMALVASMMICVAFRQFVIANAYRASYEESRGILEAYSRTQGLGVDPAFRCVSR